MPQSKRQKQERALTGIMSRMEQERENRARLQSQAVSYQVIAPSDEELRLAREANNLKRAMGLSCQTEESPF